MVNISLKIPKDLISDIDQAADDLAKQEGLVLGRSHMIRCLIQRGLNDIYGPHGPLGDPKNKS